MTVPRRDPPVLSVNLFKSTVTVSGLTLFSRVLGLVRDIVIARAFGASPGADAFFVAFKIPNFLRRLFAEGAFAQAFVPVLAEYRARGDRKQVGALINNVAGVLGGVLLLITVAGVVVAPVLVAIFAPGFLHDASRFELTVRMLRITFPYVLLISLAALAAAVLNSYGRFSVPAVTPVFLNLIMISATLWLAPMMDEPVTALAWGVFIAGVVQLSFQLPFIRGLGLYLRPTLRGGADGVRRISRLMVPGLLGSSVAQINLLIDTLVASFLATGSVSWLYYSDRLMEFPLGVFGIALATVILPSLSRYHAEASPGAFFDTIEWALRTVLLISVPACVALILLAEPILTTLFQYGEFAVRDVHMAMISLMAYAAGLPAFILVKVLAPGFFARQDMRTPVRIGVIAMVANIAMNVAFVVPMVWAGLPAPHAGLAAATSLSAFLNAGLLFHRLRRAGFHPGRGWGRFSLQVLFACSVMAAVLWALRVDVSVWREPSWFYRALRLTAYVVAGASAYGVALVLAGWRWQAPRVGGQK